MIDYAASSGTILPESGSAALFEKLYDFYLTLWKSIASLNCLSDLLA